MIGASFDRRHLKTDKLSVKEFLHDCSRNLKQTNKNVSLEKNERGLVLRIGSRKSNHYLRIYETKNVLRFELEMKGKNLHPYHHLMINHQFQEFEEKLSSDFIRYLGTTFTILNWIGWLSRYDRFDDNKPIQLDYKLTISNEWIFNQSLIVNNFSHCCKF